MKDHKLLKRNKRCYNQMLMLYINTAFVESMQCCKAALIIMYKFNECFLFIIERSVNLSI